MPPRQPTRAPLRGFALHFSLYKGRHNHILWGPLFSLDTTGCCLYHGLVAIKVPKDLTDCRRFFLEPQHPKQRQYEALRSFFVDDEPSSEVAAHFAYTPGSFRVLCHQFRRDPHPAFFLEPHHGPQSQPQKSAARDLIVSLRKQNHSSYEISEMLQQKGKPLSPTAVQEVLRQEGFARLPRRREEERPPRPRPTLEAVADVREFSLRPRTLTTECGGLFLFIPDLLRLHVDTLAAPLPGSQMIPAPHALRALLAMKLWCVERKSHVMSLVCDEGLALFAGLNVTPKKSYLSEYSSRLRPSQVSGLLAGWQRVAGDQLFAGGLVQP